MAIKNTIEPTEDFAHINNHIPMTAMFRNTIEQLRNWVCFPYNYNPNIKLLYACNLGEKKHKKNDIIIVPKNHIKKSIQIPLNHMKITVNQIKSETGWTWHKPETSSSTQSAALGTIFATQLTVNGLQ